LWYEISPALLALAREKTREFDQQKAYPEADQKLNFIGYLGEHCFDRWLTENKIPHEWIEFIKPEWDKPDFKVKKKTIDVKTTTTGNLYLPFKDPDFDIYLGARYSEIPDSGAIRVVGVGYITKQTLRTRIKTGRINVVELNGRKLYSLQLGELTSIEKFIPKMREETRDGGGISAEGLPA